MCVCCGGTGSPPEASSLQTCSLTGHATIIGVNIMDSFIPFEDGPTAACWAL